MTKNHRRQLNKLLAEACRVRDGYRCMRCGRTTMLNTSHIYPVGTHQKMRYDLDNVLTLCYPCHFHWWHRNPIEAHEWLEKILPKSRLAYLKDRANSIIRKPLKYADIRKQLQRAIAEHSRDQ